MPELPEAETIARGLGERVVDHCIAHVYLSRHDVVHGDPTPLCAALRGRRINDVNREGKQIHLHLDNKARLVVHLGMSGKLLAVRGDEPSAPHTHLRIAFTKGHMEIRYVDPRRFGGVWLLGSKPNGQWLGKPLPKIGLDALSLRKADLDRVMRRQRQIKPLLLDQQIIAGIGNIYCDEILHRARIHPLTPAGLLDGTATSRLSRAIRNVLRAAIAAGGSSISDYRTADGQRGSFQQQHRVYDRAGQSCTTCSTPIERIVIAGRGTFICPLCQPAPTQ